MTIDIEKYLRLTQTPFNKHKEAADEIERLRAEVDKAYRGFNYWEERCVRAEECLDFIFRKKRRWRLW